MSKEMFEVYIGRITGDVMYVGQGKIGRHKHLNSGISHVYEANMSHFAGKTVVVEVLLLESKNLAISKEAELILKLQPRWNRTGTNTSGMRSSLSIALRQHTHGGERQKDDWELLNYARFNIQADNTIYIRPGSSSLDNRQLHTMAVRFNRRTTPHGIYESFVRTKDETGILYTIKYREVFMANLNIQIQHCIAGISRVKIGRFDGG